MEKIEFSRWVFIDRHFPFFYSRWLILITKVINDSSLRILLKGKINFYEEKNVNLVWKLWRKFKISCQVRDPRTKIGTKTVLGPSKILNSRTRPADRSVDPCFKLNKTYQISRPAKAPIAVGSDVIVVKLRDDKAGFQKIWLMHAIEKTYTRSLYNLWKS